MPKFIVYCEYEKLMVASAELPNAEPDPDNEVDDPDLIDELYELEDDGTLTFAEVKTVFDYRARPSE